jgi:hypothetical protein
MKQYLKDGVNVEIERDGTNALFILAQIKVW